MIPDLAHLIAALPDPLAVAAAFLLAGFLAKRLLFRKAPIMRFLCQAGAFVGFTAMLMAAGVVPFEPTPATDHTIRFVVGGVFKAVWWLAASWLLVGFFRAAVVFERQPSETRFLQDLFAGVVYVGAILGIVAYVFDLPIRGLLAASGVIALVLGLALQNTLGDVFSGVVLNVAKPYHPGDWIILDGGLQGRVVETNWRATQILTPDNDLAIVPNSIIAKTKLVNASSPGTAHGITILVRLEPTVPPSEGCAVLERALLSCNRILRKPAPSVSIRALDAIALDCELQFFVATVDDGPAAQNELFDLVYRHCLSTGLRLAPPPESPTTLAPRGPRQDPKDAPRRLLDHLSIFAPLTDDERAQLAPKLKRRVWKAGEVLAEPGTVAQTLSILVSGVLIALHGDGPEEREMVRLGPGDFFGEAGLLTGASSVVRVKALTKSVVYEIAKADLDPILKERPAIAAELGQILARREAVGRARLERHLDGRHYGNLAERLAGRVRELFGVEG